MSKVFKFDFPLFYTATGLTIFGFFMLSSATLGLIGRGSANPLTIILKQIFIGGGVGFILLFISSNLNYRFWYRFSILILVLAAITMLLVFIPGLGFAHGGASRWIAIGTISFQPSEFFKLAFTCYICAWLVSRKEEIKTAGFGLLPFLIMTAIVSVLFALQPDIGTLGTIIAAAIALFYAGGGRLNHLVLSGLAILLALSALIIVEPYRRERIITFLNPDTDIQDSGYQLRQALIAVGSGGVLGRGFGESVQKFSYLPEAIGDSIFAVIGEEFGFLGALILIALFFFFLWRSIMILVRVRDNFARLFGFGIVILIIIQSFFNMASLTGILPLTGIPLPFVSHGGTSLAITLMSVGILLNISKYRTT